MEICTNVKKETAAFLYKCRSSAKNSFARLITSVTPPTQKKHQTRSQSILSTTIRNVSFVALGQLENGKCSRLYCAIFSVISFTSTFGSLVGFWNSNKVSESLETFLATFVQAFAFVIFWDLRRFRKDISSLLGNLQEDTDRVVVNQPNSRGAENVVPEKTFVWFSIFMVVFIFFFILPHFNVFWIRGVEINNEDSLIIPFWFSCGRARADASWHSVCWKIDTKWEVVVVNSLLMIQLIWLLTFYSSSFLLFFITVSELKKTFESVKGEMEIFKDNIKVRENNKTKGSENVDDPAQDRELHGKLAIEKFSQIFNHLKLLHERMLQTIDAWKGFVSDYLLFFNISIILMAFMLRIELHDSKSVAMKSAMGGVFFSTTAFVISYCTQIVSYLNEEIFDELVTIPWYEQSISFRKIYLTTLTLNRKSTKVRVAGFLECNLSNFGQMLRTGYSIFNILVLKYGK